MSLLCVICTRSLATAMKACIYHRSIAALLYESISFNKFQPLNSAELQLFCNNFLIENNNNDRCTNSVYSYHIKPSGSDKIGRRRHWPYVTCWPANIGINFTSPETRMIVLPDTENCTIISSFILTKHRNMKWGC